MDRKTYPGLLITFEGVDGCGKTTQARLAHRYLLAGGHRRVQFLREPGSTAVAERIRAILLDGRLSINETTELLLYEAARAEVTARELRPALARGEIVLCDRFYDSTTAYQGFGRKLDIRTVRWLHKVAVGDLVPDLTIVLDVDIPTAITRRGDRPDRLESESIAFFQRVRSGFLHIARKERSRVKVIDATRSVDRVFEDVKKLLARKLKRYEQRRAL
ncbi:MAG TPA: dTMP kinase [Candidatus Deferrimicrobium sp.]|nr:dTMP kinase [Candidatus Deferrimicrobium sp.]